MNTSISPERLPAAEASRLPNELGLPSTAQAGSGLRDFGFLHALPLVIAFDLVLLAVVAAAWISLK